jgi:hypothetical protein
MGNWYGEAMMGMQQIEQEIKFPGGISSYSLSSTYDYLVTVADFDGKQYSWRLKKYGQTTPLFTGDREIEEWLDVLKRATAKIELWDREYTASKSKRDAEKNQEIGDGATLIYTPGKTETSVHIFYAGKSSRRKYPKVYFRVHSTGTPPRIERVRSILRVYIRYYKDAQALAHRLVDELQKRNEQQAQNPVQVPSSQLNPPTVTVVQAPIVGAQPQPKIDDAVGATLGSLIAQEGPGLAKDWSRLKALLNDYHPQSKREVNVLVQAAQQQIPDRIANLPVGLVALLSTLAHVLHNEVGMDIQLAEWSVRTWASALATLGTRK